MRIDGVSRETEPHLFLFNICRYYSHSFVIPSMILTGITMPEMTADRIKISTIKINCRDFYCYVPNYTEAFYISSIVTSNFIYWFLQMSISVS